LAYLPTSSAELAARRSEIQRLVFVLVVLFLIIIIDLVVVVTNI
jgi:preprotein translocase subunit SecG